MPFAIGSKTPPGHGPLPVAPQLLAPEMRFFLMRARAAAGCQNADSARGRGSLVIRPVPVPAKS